MSHHNPGNRKGEVPCCPRTSILTMGRQHTRSCRCSGNRKEPCRHLYPRMGHDPSIEMDFMPALGNDSLGEDSMKPPLPLTALTAPSLGLQHKMVERKSANRRGQGRLQVKEWMYVLECANKYFYVGDAKGASRTYVEKRGTLFHTGCLPVRVGRILFSHGLAPMVGHDRVAPGQVEHGQSRADRAQRGEVSRAEMLRMEAAAMKAVEQELQHTMVPLQERVERRREEAKTLARIKDTERKRQKRQAKWEEQQLLPQPQHKKQKRG